MSPLIAVHLTGGLLALASGTIALAAGKGTSFHARAGTAFCVGMLVLGLTASAISMLAIPAKSPIGGLVVCYFVVTAWLTARRRGGAPHAVERVACAAVLVAGLAIIARAVEMVVTSVSVSGPPGPGPLFGLGGVCIAAGLLDVRYLLARTATRSARLRRHLWRMCFAFFMATGAFFLGQQQVLPAVMRGSWMLWLLAFAPLLMMVFWLARVRTKRAPIGASPG